MLEGGLWLETLEKARHTVMTLQGREDNRRRILLLPLASAVHLSFHVFAIIFLHESPRVAAQARDDSNFSPGSALPMVAAIVALAIIWFYIRYIIWRNPYLGSGRSPAAAAEDGPTPTRVERGLDAEAIQKFPTFEYSKVKGLKIGRGALECTVCLNAFEDHETLRLIPHCSHVFHRECVDAWLSDHSTCPVCRTDLIREQAKRHGFPAPDVEANRAVDVDVEGGEMNCRVLQSPPFNWPRRSKSTESSSRWRTSGLPPRSNSTGHIPYENSERLMLRLTENVRNILVKSSAERTESHTALPPVRCTREGHRS